MKKTDEFTESFQKLNLRIDEIEKMLQLLLLNDLVEDAENIVQISETNIDSKVRDLIFQFGLELVGFRNINEIETLVLGIPVKTKITIINLKWICSVIKSVYPNIEPVFMYKKVNGMQRKRILQENISFGVIGKELHVDKRRGI